MGVPICSIGSDLYILVLFAVGIISMTPSAVEFLVTVARAVADRSDGFLSASFLSNVSPVNSEDFVGVFDIADLIRKYSNDVEFHVLPMGKLQKFFDCHEILLFCDLFMDFKMSRDGRFTVKQLESLRDSFKSTRERSDSVSSIGSNKTWDLGSGDINSAHEVKAVLDSVIPNPRTQILPSSQHGGAAEDDIVALSSGEIGGSNLGMYNADLNSIEHELEVDVELNPQKNKFAKLELIENTLQGFGGGNDTNKSILHIYAHMTYKLSQCRFHEFMIAILGMTVFEAAELWLASERKSELVLVAAVYRTVAMHSWISLSETMRLKAGSDVPGRVVETGNSHWDHQYSQGSGADEPRAHAAREFGVHTAFGVPLPGVTGICGTIVFYSSKQDFQPQSLLIQLIEKAVQLMAASAVDTSWPRIEDSSTVGDFSVGPSVPLSRWLHSSTSDSGQNNLHSSVPTQSISNSSDQLPPLPYRKPSDFEQKLQICRTLVNGPRSSQHDLCGDCTSPPLKVAAVGADAFPASFYPPHYPGVVEFDPRILAHYSSMNMDNTPVGIIPEHEVTAAYTLANFGKVEWHSYLESSGITNDDGHQPAKIASTHDLELYEQPDRSNLKREHSSKSQASNISALPLCKVEGCTSAVENSAAQYCAAHRSTRRCQKEGCNKCAQGATKYCIAHGGGRRCTFPGCFKGARDKFFCAAHGGGKRCTFSGCTKSAVGGSNLCTAHGGGKRCQYPDCTKSSQSNTMYCVRHGGGRSCMYAGCTKVFETTAELHSIELTNVYLSRLLEERLIIALPMVAVCAVAYPIATS